MWKLFTHADVRANTYKMIYINFAIAFGLARFDIHCGSFKLVRAEIGRVIARLTAVLAR